MSNTTERPNISLSLKSYFHKALNHPKLSLELKAALKLKLDEELEKVLTILSESYYNDGVSLVSDEVFDLLKDELKKKNPLNKLQNPVRSFSARVHHFGLSVREFSEKRETER